MDITSHYLCRAPTQEAEGLLDQPPVARACAGLGRTASIERLFETVSDREITARILVLDLLPETVSKTGPPSYNHVAQATTNYRLDEFSEN